MTTLPHSPAVLDANVLFPFTLRDTLLRAAAAGMYQVFWSEEILAEVCRNLQVGGRMNEAQIANLMKMMRVSFPEAPVYGYEKHIPNMTNELKDRHVAAVAVTCGARTIVTFNLKDFRPLPTEIRAQSPDTFLLHLLKTHEEKMMNLLNQQAAALKNPPVTLDQLLAGLHKTVPQFAAAVRPLLGPHEAK